MLKKVFLSAACLTVSIFSGNAFALDFTLGADGANNSKGANAIANLYGPTNDDYLAFAGTLVTSPRSILNVIYGYPYGIPPVHDQVMEFTVEFENVWGPQYNYSYSATNSFHAMDHLIFALRGNFAAVKSPSGALDNPPYANQFKGIVIGASNYVTNDSNNLRDCYYTPQANPYAAPLLWEYNFSQPGVLCTPASTTVQTPASTNSPRGNLTFQDNVKYNFKIDASDDTISYTITDQSTGSSWYAIILNGALGATGSESSYELLNSDIGIIPAGTCNSDQTLKTSPYCKWKINVTNLITYWQ